MTQPIARRDVESRAIDLADVVEPHAEPLAPVPPGQILRDEFLRPLGLSARQVAGAIGAPHNRLSEIINGKRAITADTALRLGIYLGTTPAFWLSLQSAFDLRCTERAHGERLRREIKPLACSTRI